MPSESAVRKWICHRALQRVVGIKKRGNISFLSFYSLVDQVNVVNIGSDSFIASLL